LIELGQNYFEVQKKIKTVKSNYAQDPEIPLAVCKNIVAMHEEADCIIVSGKKNGITAVQIKAAALEYYNNGAKNKLFDRDRGTIDADTAFEIHASDKAALSALDKYPDVASLRYVIGEEDVIDQD